jgi:hypothetical protein
MQLSPHHRGDEAMIERPDLPLRDILRAALPGIVAATYAELLSFVYSDSLIFENAITLTFVAIAALLGAASFSAGVHGWLWSARWNAFLAAIRAELGRILNRILQEREAKARYKLWLEASDSQAELRSYLQYSTGVFYSVAALTAWSAICAVASAPAFVAGVYDLLCTRPFPSALFVRLSLLPASVGLMLLFRKKASAALTDLEADTMLALNFSSVRRYLRRIDGGRL